MKSNNRIIEFSIIFIAMELFDNMDSMLRIFWYIAIPSSLFFLGQTIMTFVGLDSGDGLDADFDSDLDAGDGGPSQIFSLRNLINFLLGFSWTGVSLYNKIDNKFYVGLIATVVGLIFLFLFFFVIRQLKKLAEDNSFKLQNTIEKIGEVYLTIPAEKKGSGKILISVNGAMHELTAATEENVNLQSGSLVKVLRIEGDNLLIVKPI